MNVCLCVCGAVLVCKLMCVCVCVCEVCVWCVVCVTFYRSTSGIIGLPFALKECGFILGVVSVLVCAFACVCVLV